MTRKETLDKIKSILQPEEPKKSKVSISIFSLKAADKLSIGKELLKPIVEIIDYESTSGKLFTEGKDLKTPEIKLSFYLEQLSLFGFVDDDSLAKEQDKARQQLEYQQDTAAIGLLRQDPIKCASFKEGIDKILDEFNKRKLVCTHICIPRILVIDLVKHCSTMVVPIQQRELIMAGYIGSLQDTEIQFITTAGTNTFELLDSDEFFGLDSTKCKRECVDPLTCLKYGDHIKFKGGIKFEVDPEAVVWAKINN